MDCLYLLGTLFPNFIVLFLLLIISHKRYPLQDMSACDTYSSCLEDEAFPTEMNRMPQCNPSFPSTHSLPPSTLENLENALYMIFSIFSLVTLIYFSLASVLTAPLKFLLLSAMPFTTQLQGHFSCLLVHSHGFDLVDYIALDNLFIWSSPVCILGFRLIISYLMKAFLDPSVSGKETTSLFFHNLKTLTKRFVHSSVLFSLWP